MTPSRILPPSMNSGRSSLYWKSSRKSTSFGVGRSRDGEMLLLPVFRWRGGSWLGVTVRRGFVEVLYGLWRVIARLVQHVQPVLSAVVY